MNPVVVIVLAVAVVAVLLLMGRDEGKDVTKRIEEFTAADGVLSEDALLKAQEDRERKKASGGPTVLGGMGAVLQNLAPKRFAEWISERLEKADVPLRANEFAAIIFLTMVGGFLFGLIAYKNRGVAAVFSLLFAGMPFLWLKVMFWRRLKLFNGQILDTLLLLSNAVKAGYSLLQAMEMISRESPPPMGKEFARVVRETQLGITVEDALVNLRDRLPSDDLDLVVTVVLIQRQIGGNMSEILDKIAHTVRERMRILGQISTLTAQGRMSGIVIGGLPFGLGFVLSLINPGYISLLWTFDDGVMKGYYLLILGCIMEAIGFFFIWKIVDIEV